MSLPAKVLRRCRPGLLSGLLSLVAAQAPAQAQTLPAVKLNAGIHLITAELATDEATRTRGLMFRERLAANHGMLFDFERKAVHCMWMRNTLIALSVAFIADDGTIVNIEDMQPHDETSRCARQPVRYALEMELGWFVRRGIGAGSRLGGLPKR